MNIVGQELKGRLFIQALAQNEKSVLEIGPFCNPVLRGANVSYFDVLDKQGLISRAEAIDYPINFAPDITFVSPIGDLSIIDAQFSAVLSSHCIEHQPDLVGHLPALRWPHHFFPRASFKSYACMLSSAYIFFRRLFSSPKPSSG